jgi:hypothetical protein
MADGLDASQLRIVLAVPNLLAPQDVRDLSGAIGPADVIVIDTLAQVTAGANENSSEDMGKALAACRSLHEATGAVVVVVHHAGKDASRGARGWSGLKGAADAELEVTRDGDLRRARVSKQKDGTDGDVLAFRLRTVELGRDEDGDPITSCVVEHNVTFTPTERQPSGKAQRELLAALRANPADRWAFHELVTIGKAIGLARTSATDAAKGLAGRDFIRLDGNSYVLACSPITTSEGRRK